MRTHCLNALQVKGLCKLGDIIVPGDGTLPRFSKTKFYLDVDRMLNYLPKDDLEGLKFLLALFALLPSIVIKMILLITELKESVPTFLAAPLRLISVGLKGLIFTLYYSKLDDQDGYGEKIMETLKYHTHINYQPAPNNVSPENLKHIITMAQKAHIEISHLSVKQRLVYVARVKAAILDNYNEIIDVVQKDTKKSRSDALISEIFSVLDYLEFLFKESDKALIDQAVKTPIMLMGKKSFIYHEALGTVLTISPWNYPFFQAIVPLMTSFVCGNANIYKPSEFTPLKGLLEKILMQAGWPVYWIQVVYGDGVVGANLIDQRPDKIFFTGSVATGKKIMAQAAKYLIPVELELGGKDAAIVFDDVNIERATSGVLWGALTNLGQSCTSVERVYIQENIFESFKTALVTKAQAIVQKIDSDGNADVGEMTTKQQIQIVKEHLNDALAKGAKLLTGQNWDQVSGKIPPLVLENVTPQMKIYSEETFGPIIPLIKFKSEQEAVELANDSNFGLSASVWSKDLERGKRVTKALKVGNVSVNNVMLTEGNPYLPFGGVKESGIGRYKGVVGFQTFCNLKSVLIDKDSKKIEANWYPYTTKKYQLFESLTLSAFAGGILAFIKFALTGMKLEGFSQKTKRE